MGLQFVDHDLGHVSPILDFNTWRCEVIYVVLSCLAYIALSSSLINYNKFLMHADYFPYSVRPRRFYEEASRKINYVNA